MADQDVMTRIRAAASLIHASRYLTAFTGAGISVESGIPPFRGEGGLWSKYDPRKLELDYFLAHPDKAWPVIKEIFYDHFGQAKPNAAHKVLAAWENEGWPQGEGGAAGGGRGAPNSPGASAGRRREAAPAGRASAGQARLKALITQNIDNLHVMAGSRNVIEFHGNSRTLVCLACRSRVEAVPALLEILPPRCPCGGIYKPDFIFFGEGIPSDALERSIRAAEETDVMLVVGSTGGVYPAADIPRRAKRNGAGIIEINPSPSELTPDITDVFIEMKACEAAERIALLLRS